MTLPVPGDVCGKAAEKAYQKTVQETLDVFRWKWMHVYPLTDSHGVWRTPTSGPMAKGWPDLICFRGEWTLAIEVKGYSADGRPTPFQPGQIDNLTLISRTTAALAWVLRPTDPYDDIVSWLRFPDKAPVRFGW